MNSSVNFGFDLKKVIVIALILIIGAFFLGYSAGYKAAKGESPERRHKTELEGMNIQPPAPRATSPTARD